jgi:hypothetical protein
MERFSYCSTRPINPAFCSRRMLPLIRCRQTWYSNGAPGLRYRCHDWKNEYFRKNGDQKKVATQMFSEDSAARVSSTDKKEVED